MLIALTSWAQVFNRSRRLVIAGLQSEYSAPRSQRIFESSLSCQPTRQHSQCVNVIRHELARGVKIAQLNFVEIKRAGGCRKPLELTNVLSPLP